MKEVLLIVLLIFVGLLKVSAVEPTDSDDVGVEIYLNCKIPIGNPVPKMPIVYPKLYKKGYKLSIPLSHGNYILRLLSGDEIVYEALFNSFNDFVFIPTFYCGSFELQLITGVICFWGYIYM